MADPQHQKTRARRGREFTKQETLARHPILLLFDRPDVKKVLSWRRERGLRFRDLQMLLCKNPPTAELPRECPKNNDCHECRRFRRCVSEKTIIWISNIPENIRESLRIYNDKSHLAEDLLRLCSTGYLKKPSRGYYEPEKRKQLVARKALVKRKLKELIETCSESMIHEGEGAVFLYLEEESVNKYSNRIERLRLPISLVRTRLSEIAVNDALRQIAHALKSELSRLEDDKKRVRLWRYVNDHVRTRLGSMGMPEERFSKELKQILGVSLGVEKVRLKAILKELEAESEILREAKERISRAMWLNGITPCPAEKYQLLTMEYLFALEPGHRQCLEEGKADDELRMAFRRSGRPLSDDASISSITNRAWIIQEPTREYEIRDVGRWLRVYEKKRDGDCDLRTLSRTRELLKEDDDFQRWFEKSEMYMPVDLVQAGPAVVIW